MTIRGCDPDNHMGNLDLFLAPGIGLARQGTKHWVQMLAHMCMLSASQIRKKQINTHLLQSKPDEGWFKKRIVFNECILKYK